MTGSQSGTSPFLFLTGRESRDGGAAGYSRDAEPAADGGLGSILVVDDDDDFREILVEILAMAGFRMLQASTGLQGLDLALRERPDLIVLDQRMPGLSGADVVRNLRARNFRLPIVLVTAAKDIAQLAHNLDVEYYLQKPVGLAQLKATIEQALASSPAVE